MIMDRRKYERFRVDIPAMYKKREYFFLSKKGKGTVENVSIGGASLLTRDDIFAFTQFQQIRLTMNLPNSGRQVKIVTEIVKPDQSKHKLHLKFIKITKQDKPVFVKFIKTLEEKKELFSKEYKVSLMCNGYERKKLEIS